MVDLFYIKKYLKYIYYQNICSAEALPKLPGLVYIYRAYNFPPYFWEILKNACKTLPLQNFSIIVEMHGCNAVPKSLDVCTMHLSNMLSLGEDKMSTAIHSSTFLLPFSFSLQFRIKVMRVGSDNFCNPLNCKISHRQAAVGNSLYIVH